MYLVTRSWTSLWRRWWNKQQRVCSNVLRLPANRFGAGAGAVLVDRERHSLKLAPPASLSRVVCVCGRAVCVGCVRGLSCLLSVVRALCPCRVIGPCVCPGGLRFVPNNALIM